ncbi:PAS domain S-box-containing protein [Halopelagius inordinatus]|uniref:histidine kinase n=1 Tax=Halopelagius inordinatus TaxID=553467 RepID=A0A1I2RNU9_9EURY|nr:ATP-binding protein [Halopelagius inordinatus]SFG41763.1 PAS domain S-box-containing protein [Halopelagius inordinatus]
MSPTLSLAAVYASALLVSAGLAFGVGVWAHRYATASDAALFTGLMLVDTLWGVSSFLEVVWSDPTLVAVAATARTVLSLSSVVVWFYFASTYAGREVTLRSPDMLAMTVGYVVLTALTVTMPFHDLLGSVTVVTDAPFVHASSETTPVGLLGFVYAAVGIWAGVVRLASLFLRSRHRPSTAVFALTVSGIGSAAPAVVAGAGFAPVPTFDHTALGIGFFAVGSATAVFKSGLLTIEPVARDVLFEEFTDPVVVLDGEGRVADYNAAAETLCRGSGGELAVGEPYRTACPELASVVSPGRRPDARGGDTRTEEVTITRDDERIHYSVRVSPLSADATLGHALVFRDVTDLATYRRELERQNEQLDQFARTVTHDLRNPLNVAQGYLELVSADVEAAADGDLTDAESAALRDAFETVTRTHERMREIVEDIQTLARKGKSVEETERLSFGAVAREAWQTVETGDATLLVAGDGELVADRSRLVSVFENLFSNSIHHAGRDVTIEVELTGGGFVVRDDGPGIDADERARVFEYGYTTSRRGNGLGLAIVRTMAESHGWTVSIPGGGPGATFAFDGVLTNRNAESTGAVPTESARDGDDD